MTAGQACDALYICVRKWICVESARMALLYRGVGVSEAVRMLHRTLYTGFPFSPLLWVYSNFEAGKRLWEMAGKIRIRARDLLKSESVPSAASIMLLEVGYLRLGKGRDMAFVDRHRQVQR